MILCDNQIVKAFKEGKLIIDPYNPTHVGTNSYDVCLGDTLAVYHTKEESDLDNGRVYEVLDLERTPEYFNVPDKGIVLEPGIGYLGATLEYIATDCFVPWLAGRSSTGRRFISIHAEAGVGDAGFGGHWTLEITVTQAVRLKKNEKIGQMVFFTMEGVPTTLYRDKQFAKYANRNSNPIPFKRDPSL